MKILKILFVLCLLVGSNYLQSQSTSCVEATIRVVGDPNLTLCLGDGEADEIRFRSSPQATPFAYIVVDQNDIIVSLSLSNTIDFEALPEGELRVFSVSFIGQLLGAVGDNYLETEFGTICSRLSQNFITISNLTPNGGMVTTAAGEEDITLCIDPGVANVVDFVSDSDFEPYLFVITNEENFIIGTSEDGTVDFTDAPPGICRVWGLAYLGEYTGLEGDNILFTDLSDACFDLSSNFVNVIRLSPESGSIAFSDGSESFVSCTTLPPSGTISIASTGNGEGTPTTFIAVDQETGLVSYLFDEATIDLATQIDGTFTLYSLAYTGNLNVSVGAPLDPDNLSDECADLSNGISLIKRVINADDINLADGSSEVTICVGDGIADPLTFTNTYLGDDNFIYLITDESNFLLGTSTEATIDFEGAEAGICRVWGLAYSGNLDLTQGQNIGAPSQLSDECFDLSDGFVLVNRNGPEGGSILFSDGTDSFTSCSETAPEGLLTAVVSGNDPNSAYAYLLVDNSNNTIAVIYADGNIDLATLPAGNFSLYGVSYTGELAATAGTTYDPAALANCFDVSDNSLGIINRIQNAGDISLADGSTATSICVGDGVADELTITTTYNGDDSFIYVITDDNNLVLGTSTTGIIDFEGAGAGDCRVWGLVFSGNLNVTEGDNLTGGQALSDECFDLSEGFVAVTRYDLEGGTLQYADGSESFVSCSELPPTGILTATVSGSDNVGSYAFLLVNNEDNTVVSVFTDADIDLGSLPTGNFVIYGLSYLGDLLVNEGDVFDPAVLSTDCNELSTNTLQLINRIQNADNVSLSDGSDDITICVGDGVPDVLTFNSSYVGDDNFIYVITDEGNFVLDTSLDGIIDFEGAGAGVCRVWGLVYSGNLILNPGDNLGGGQDLSDECFDLSDGFVRVNRNGPVGGTISFADGSSDPLFSCSPLDVNPLPAVTVSDNEPGADYAFLLVDNATGTIRAILEDGLFNETELDNGEYTIYGLSFLGDLPYGVGDIFDPANLVDCVDLSDNILLIIRQVQHADNVQLEDGSTEIAICVGDGVADELVFTNTYAGEDNFVYVITNEGNFVLGTSTSGIIDFEDADAGICRVWGIAYTGNLTLVEGDNLGENIAFSDQCFDLTDNFVTINRNGPDGGTLAFADGSTSFEDCQTASGSVLDFGVTDAAASLAYAYLVVNTENDQVVAILTDPSLDLATLPEGTYAIHGVSYLDNLTVAVGDQFSGAPLADVCFDLSDNSLMVVNRSVVVNEITFEDGSDTKAICPDNNVVDILSFLTDYTGADNLAFLITTTDNTILEILASNSTSFEDYNDDFVRVWAVAFSGNFLLQQGVTLDPTTVISTECYDLSNNFLLVDLRGPDGGSVSLEDGSNEISVCTNDGIPDELSLVNTAPEGTSYAYIITDENNNILNSSTSPIIDFETVPAGICRLWGVAYLGDLQVAVGENAEQAEFSTDCFDLSDNFVVVFRTEVDGATVSLEDGSNTAFTCSGDGEADFFTFINTSTSTENYTYILTDDENNILVVLDGNSVDLDLAAPGDCRAWGLSYSGNIIVETGISLDGAVLTDDCYALSSNFVTFHRDQVVGGDVSLNNGNTLVNVCSGDGTPDVLNFTNTGTSTGGYTYVLTDVNNNILSSFPGTLDFDALVAPGEIRIWGVAFTGLPSIMSGNIEEVVLSNLCYDLSNNFVTVIREQPNGGTVATTDAETTLYLCTDDGIDDIYSFANQGASNTPYVYLITDENNTILDILTNTNMANFEGAENGICRVWGLAYTGTLLAEAGEDAAAVSLSDDCFSLSSNFVTVVRGELNAGTVASTTGTGNLFTCPGDGMPDLITFNSQGAGSGDFAYVLTDESNIIVAVTTNNQIDFEELAEGTYRLWGMVTTGDLLAMVGDDAAATVLASGCYDLSDNFITIVNIAPVAGDLSLEGGGSTIEICIGDGIPDPFSVVVEGASDAAYTYLVVDEDNILVGTLNDPTFNFENAAPGDWSIYGLSYTGVISALPGANILEDQLVSGCFELTSSFIFVDKTQVDGGSIFTDNSEEVIYTCPDGISDITNFINSGISTEANYSYVLTTQSNFVLSILTGNSIDFEEATGLDALRIWGVSYTGELLLSIGNILTDVSISDGCNALSDNFIDIFIDQPEGGQLSFDDGTDSLRLCYSNFMPGVHVNTTSTASVGYAYILTDLDNIAIEVSEPADDVVSFDNVMPGNYRIWAVSYTGQLSVSAGDDVTMVDLASSCFELSENFLNVERTEALDAGLIGTMTEEEIIYVCPGDGVPDIVIFNNTSDDPNFRYIITDDQNRILFGDIESNIINFDIADIGVCRVYGVSYTGEFTPLFMADATTTQLSTDCWALTDNFITIVKQLPEGGTVSTVDGNTGVEVTVGDGIADVVNFTNTGLELLPYAYLITDENNEILGISTDGAIDFEGAGEGTCRVWGLSYTGNITAGMGDDIDEVLLATGCYDLSDNFVIVIRTSGGGIQPEEPGSLFADEQVITLSLYPNPAIDELQVSVLVPNELLTDQQTVQVFNLNGMLLFEQQLMVNPEEGRTTLDISQLQEGMYFLRWYDGEQVIFTSFIKQ